MPTLWCSSPVSPQTRGPLPSGSWHLGHDHHRSQKHLSSSASHLNSETAGTGLVSSLSCGFAHILCPHLGASSRETWLGSFPSPPFILPPSYLRSSSHHPLLRADTFSLVCWLKLSFLQSTHKYLISRVFFLKYLTGHVTPLLSPLTPMHGVHN